MCTIVACTDPVLHTPQITPQIFHILDHSVPHKSFLYFINSPRLSQVASSWVYVAGKQDLLPLLSAGDTSQKHFTLSKEVGSAYMSIGIHVNRHMFFSSLVPLLLVIPLSVPNCESLCFLPDDSSPVYRRNVVGIEACCQILVHSPHKIG